MTETGTCLISNHVKSKGQKNYGRSKTKKILHYLPMIQTSFIFLENYKVIKTKSTHDSQIVIFTYLGLAEKYKI